MADPAKLEYAEGRVVITRCYSEGFNEELKALPRTERGFDWDEKHWWADDVHGPDIVRMMVRHFGSVQVFGCPRHRLIAQQAGCPLLPLRGVRQGIKGECRLAAWLPRETRTG